jgi:hypothetical protein
MEKKMVEQFLQGFTMVCSPKIVGYALGAAAIGSIITLCAALLFFLIWYVDRRMSK